MKYFTDPISGKVYAYDDDAPSHFVATGLVPMSEAAVNEYIRDATVPVSTDADGERAWRDSELASLIWLRDRHRDQQEIGGDTTLSADQFAELLVYMQALRDWPQSPDFPDSDKRPVGPSWIRE